MEDDLNIEKINDLINKYVEKKTTPNKTNSIETLTNENIREFKLYLKYGSLDCAIYNDEEYLFKYTQANSSFDKIYTTQIPNNIKDMDEKFFEVVEDIHKYLKYGNKLQDNLNRESILKKETREEYLNKFYTNIAFGVEMIKDHLKPSSLTLEKLFQQRQDQLKKNISETCQLIQFRNEYNSEIDTATKNNLVELQYEYEEYELTTKKLQQKSKNELLSLIQKTLHLVNIETVKFTSNTLHLIDKYKPEKTIVKYTQKEEKQIDSLGEKYYNPKDYDEFMINVELEDLSNIALTSFKSSIKLDTIEALLDEDYKEVIELTKVYKQLRKDYAQQTSKEELKIDDEYFEAITLLKKYILKGNNLHKQIPFEKQQKNIELKKQYLDKFYEDINMSVTKIREQLDKPQFNPDQDSSKIPNVNINSIHHLRKHQMDIYVAKFQLTFAKDKHQQIVPTPKTLKLLINYQRLFEEHQLTRSILNEYDNPEDMNAIYDITYNKPSKFNAPILEQELEVEFYFRDIIPTYTNFNHTEQ